MKKRLIIALALFVLLSTYKSKNLFTISKFNIKEIKIENNFILKDKDIKKDLIFLYNKNLFFLNSNDIEKILKKKSLVQSFEIKKIYPNKLKIKVFEKKPIAILQNKKNFFYISENIDLINYFEFEEYKNLPIIFGDKKSFEVLYKNLKAINFPVNLVKNYYLYESKRWDLVTYKKKIIKLPHKDYKNSLKNFMNLRDKSSFDKYDVFDYRISNQLILQ
tara:strand:+ start:55 stop:711 length:657 start_codon:yes stop_codon:yes gene_type:complete